MKKRFIITEEERKHILNLYEQTRVAYKFSDESLPARKFLYQEFNLFKFNPNFSSMTPEQQIKSLRDAKDRMKNMDKDELVRKSKLAGVSEESIKALQNDLKTLSGSENLSFYSDGVKKDFTDGLLGTNTAAALFDYQIYLTTKTKDTEETSEVRPIKKGSSDGSVKSSYDIGR